MAYGEQIKHSDIIQPGNPFEAAFKGLESMTKLMKDFIEAAKKIDATGKGYKKLQESQREGIKLSQQMLKLKKNEVDLRVKLQGAASTQADRVAELNVQNQQQNKINTQLARVNLAAAGSYNKLQAEMAINIRKMKEMRVTNEAERKKREQLAQTIKKQNNQLKKMDSTMGNHQRNVGDYAGQVGMLGGKLGMIPMLLTKFQAGLQLVSAGFRTLRGAIISTGIGALVVALGSLVTYFQTASSGATKLAKFMAPLKAIFTSLKNLAQQFGEALALFAEGEWDEGFKVLKGAVNGVSSEYQKQLSLQKSLAELERIHHEARKESILTIAQYRQRLEENRLAAKDEEIEISKRLAAQKQAIELRNKIAEEEIRLAELQVSILATQSQMAQDSREEEIALEEARAAVAEKRASSAKEQQRMVTYLTTLVNKYNASLESQVDTNSKIITSLEQIADAQAKVNEKILESIELRSEYSDKWQSTAAEVNNAQEQTLGVVQETSQKASELAEKGTGEYKVLKSSEAVISTYAAANQVLADKSLPFIAKIPAMIVTILTGLANVAKINAVGLAEGTEVVTGGEKGKDSVPAMLMPGERVLTTEQNKHLSGIPNDDIPGLVKLGVMAKQGDPVQRRLLKEQLIEQRISNQLIGRWETVYPDGSIKNLRGDKKKYIN